MQPKDWTGNKKSVYTPLGASSHVPEPRAENDYYATSPLAAEWLLKIEQFDHKIWECACGSGHLSKVFEQAGHEVRSTDLVYRGYGEGKVDFLAVDTVWNGDIITNPPYKYAVKFINKALESVPDGHKVAMFLRLQFLEGQARKPLFTKNPPIRVWVSSARIPCAKNGNFSTKGSAIAFAWFVWEKGYHGATTLKWFN